MIETLENVTTAAVGVTLHGLTKSFVGEHGTVQAVRGVDVSIDAGETVALLGPNGAGKSTTVDMMLGLLQPDAGSVRLFGGSPREAVASGRVGAMLQTGSLLRDLSVRELITMVASLYPQPLGVDETISLTGIEEIADRMTQKLSGGETQRARFAIALVSNPDLLVLDEPTVAMDVEARRAFWTTMRAFAARGRTVMFATHYLEEADAYADRVVLMANGRVVADGPPTEIKAMVGGRRIRATLPGAHLFELESLPGVTHAEQRGEAVILSCSDSDAAIRALLARFPNASDLEITGAGLEDAFVELTGKEDAE
ncbi:MAG TPA: ABC transporter ATP-binding protein [Gaiellaceae bacterium]|jgi:ABC-2 type transport system ATP-binding protein|nr:ABC transporter ATP-binding protein [Gaiellaceae bacterium]